MAPRNKKSTSFLMWKSPRMKTTTTTTRKRKRNPRPTKTRRRPVRQTPTRRPEGILAAADALRRAPLTLSPQVPVHQHLVRSTSPGECGPADEPLRPAAGGPCFPDGPGRRHRGHSRPTVRAAPPAAASRLAWSCPHPSTAPPQGQRFPHPADTSLCPPREGCPPSDPLLPFVPFRPAAVGHRKQGLQPHPLGYIKGPLDTCRGRALVQRLPHR